MPEAKAEPEDHQAEEESQIELVKGVQLADAEVNEDVHSGNAEETVKGEVQDRTLPLTEFSVQLTKENKNEVVAATTQLVPKKEAITAIQQTDDLNVPLTEDKEVSEKEMAELQEKGPPVEDDASKVENVEDIESEALSTHRDSDEINLQLFKSEEAIPTEETKVKNPKEEEEVPLTLNVEPEKDHKATVVAAAELTQEQAVAEQKEDMSGSITKEESLLLEGTLPGTENNVKPEDQDQEAVDALRPDFIPETVQVEVLKSEEVEVLKSGEITDGVLAEETTIGELKNERELLHKNSSVPDTIDEAAVDSTRTASESKENNIPSVQRDDTAEGIAGENIENNSNAETEEPQVKDTKSNPFHEQAVPCDEEEDTAFETKTVEQEEKAFSGQEFIATAEEKLEKEETLVEETRRPDTDKKKASDREQFELQLNKIFAEVESQKPETNTDDIPPDVLEEKEEVHTREITEELDTCAAEHVSLDTGKTSLGQVFEQVIKEIPASCVDIDVRLGYPGSRSEEEKGDNRKDDVRTAVNVHALAMQVTTCHLKEVSASFPTLIEKTSVEEEALMSSSVNESEETAFTGAQLMKDTMAETAQVGNEVMMKHVPVTPIKHSDRIQARVVDVDITPGERIFDSLLEVRVNEDKETIKVCHRSVEKVENVSAFLDVEEVSNEDNVGILQGFVEQVKRTRPKTLPEFANDNFREEVLKKEPDRDQAGECENLAKLSHQEDISQSLDVSLHQEEISKHDLKKPDMTENATCPSAELPANEDNMDTTAADTFQSQSLSDPAVPTNLSFSEQEKSLASILNTARTKKAEPLVVTEGEEADKTTMLTEERMSQIYPVNSQKDTHLTKVGSQSPVVEEHLPQTDLVGSHETFEMTVERAPVEEEPLTQIDRVEIRQDKAVTEEVAQIPAAKKHVFQEDPGDRQEKEEIKDLTHHPIAKKPVTQIDQFDSQPEKQIGEDGLLATVIEEPSSQTDTVKIEKDTEVTDECVQGSVEEEMLFQIDPVDNQKEVTTDAAQVPATEVLQADTGVSPEQTKLTEIRVLATEAVKLFVIIDTTELAKKHSAQTGSLQATESEDLLLETQPDICQKDTDLNEVGFQAPGTEEQTNVDHRQTELPMENVQATDTGEHLSQIDPKQTELSEGGIQAQEEEFLPPCCKQTALTEYFHASEVEDLSQTQYGNIHNQAEKPEEAVQTPESEESLSTKDPADSQKQTALIEKHVPEPEPDKPVFQTDSVSTLENVAQQTEEPSFQNCTVQDHKQTKLTKERDQETEAKNLSGTDPFESHKKKGLTEKHVKALQADESMSEENPLVSQKQTELPKEHVRPKAEESLCQTESVKSQNQAAVKEEHVQGPKHEESLSKPDSNDSHKHTMPLKGLDLEAEEAKSLSQTQPKENPTREELAEEQVQIQEADAPSSLRDAVEREAQKDHVLEQENVLFKTDPIDSYKKTEHRQEPEAQKDLDEEKQADLCEKPVHPVLQKKPSKRERQTVEHVLQQEPEPVKHYEQRRLPEVGIQMKATSEPNSTETKYPSVLMVSAMKPKEILYPVEEMISTDHRMPEAPVKEAEEENEQDVWMDAEEDKGIREEAEAEQPLQSSTPQEPGAVGYKDVQIRSNPKVEAQDSEGEDLNVAAENTKTVTESVAVMERD